MSDREPLLLGIDLGTSRVKATLADALGDEVASASSPTPLGIDRRGRVECGAYELLESVATALDKLNPEARRRVEGVGLAGMAESGASFDASGTPSSPIVSWNDPRGQEVVDRLHDALGAGIDLAIGQRLRTIASVVKLGWIVDEADGGRVARWYGVPELVLHTLTGAWATEDSLAARTGAYELATSRWMPEVTSVMGLSTSIFPPVARAGTAMGRISADGAAWVGLPPGVPVTIAGHDHLVGMVGAAIGRADMANSVGTAETLVGRALDRPDVAAAIGQRVAVTLAPGDGAWALLASAARAGIVVEAAATMLGHSLTELDALAHIAPDPGLDLSEVVVDLAAGGRPSLPERDTGQLWRALLTALVWRTSDALERIASVAGMPERVVTFGGGSRSGPWTAIKASALAVPLWRSPVADAVARGAVVFAGVAAGWWKKPEDAPAPKLTPVRGAQEAARTRSEMTFVDPPGAIDTP